MTNCSTAAKATTETTADYPTYSFTYKARKKAKSLRKRLFNGALFYCAFWIVPQSTTPAPARRKPLATTHCSGKGAVSVLRRANALYIREKKKKKKHIRNRHLMRARTSSLHKTEYTRLDIKLPTFHDEHTSDRKLYPHHGPSSRSTHNKQWGHSLTANILPGTWYSDTSSNRSGAHLPLIC